MIHVEPDTQRLVAISLKTEYVPAGRTALPPGHPPGREESSSRLPCPAHPSPRDKIPRNTPFTFPTRKPMCTGRQEEAQRAVKENEEMTLEMQVSKFNGPIKDSKIVKIGSSFKICKVKT